MKVQIMVDGFTRGGVPVPKDEVIDVSESKAAWIESQGAGKKLLGSSREAKENTSEEGKGERKRSRRWSESE